MSVRNPTHAGTGERGPGNSGSVDGGVWDTGLHCPAQTVVQGKMGLPSLQRQEGWQREVGAEVG